MSVRVGIIGSGLIGQEHIRNLKLVPSTEIVAVADNHHGSLDAAKALLTIPDKECKCKFTDSYEELLGMDDVDAVLVATPNFHHIQVLRKAIPTGKHILCEKPICISIQECAEVEYLLEESGRYAVFGEDFKVNTTEDVRKIFWVGMEYRYYPSISRLIAEVHGGTVGNLHMFSIREHRFPFLDKIGSWNRFKINTGDTLVEKACHFFDLMRFVVQSEPVSIYASGSQDVNHIEEKYSTEAVVVRKGHAKTDTDGALLSDILDNAYVIVNFKNGVRALLDLCMFAEASTNQEELAAVGSKGKVEAFAPSHGQKENSQGSYVRIGRRCDWVSRSTAPDPKTMKPIEQIQTEIEAKLMEAGDHGGATYYEQKDFINSIFKCAGPISQPALKGVGVKDGVLAVIMGVAAHRSIDQNRVVMMSEMLEELDKAREDFMHSQRKRQKY